MNNSVICVDASLVIAYLVDPDGGPVERLWQQWLQERCPLHAPALIRFELTNGLYQYYRHGWLSAKAVEQGVIAALRLPIVLCTESNIHRRALHFTQRFNLPATYDAHYLAVAEQAQATLWTLDKKLFNCVKHDLPWVRCLER